MSHGYDEEVAQEEDVEVTSPARALVLGLRVGFAFREAQRSDFKKPAAALFVRRRLAEGEVYRAFSDPDFGCHPGLWDDVGARSGTWLETRMTRAICSSKATPAADTDRLAKRLSLTDPQKAALKDLSDASASAEASAKTSLCADKTDLSTTLGRMAFAEKMAETSLPV